MITMKIDYNITRKKLNEYVIDLIYDILEKYGKYFDKEIIEIFEQKKEAKLNKF
jgi:hypothetical protein